MCVYVCNVQPARSLNNNTPPPVSKTPLSRKSTPLYELFYLNRIYNTKRARTLERIHLVPARIHVQLCKFLTHIVRILYLSTNKCT